MARRVAFVTGASRGIGKASALALGKVGFDIVVTARTLHEGEQYEHSPRLARSDTRPLPGSIEGTAQEIQELGARALPIRLDLLDRASLESAVETALAEWGRIDLLLNNAVYTGPGTLDHFMDVPLEVYERIFQANLFSQVFLTKLVLPHMLERGSGIIINVTSAAGMQDPPFPAGQGGWGLAYGASKAAFHRMAGVLKVELAGRGIRTHNLEPGLVITEAMKQSGLAEEFLAKFGGTHPGVPAAVVAWLASHPEAEELNGQTVFAQAFYQERGLGD
jgi:NAD(P)-dependent dehydrogenase (short-subunit alcohol dehydrogenase family)